MNNIIKKGVVVAVILLFVSVSVIPSSGTNVVEKSSNVSFDGNTLYVGGNGTGNYTRIQDAIDNASDGDTVFVYSGIYSDYFPYYSPPYVVCVVIDKRINLIGEDKNNTIINGSGRYDVINIEVDRVNISGFTIQNGGESQYIPGTSRYGRGIYSHGGNNISIHDNIIFDNYVGIYSSCNEGNIFDNIIKVNRRGIDIHSSSLFNKIYNNTISNNEIGIEKYGDLCTFEKNLISNNEIGILLLSGKSNFISNNAIRENEIGLKTEDYGDSIIHQNNFINNKKHIDISKRSTLLHTPFLILYKNKWTKNFWDNWKVRIPRPIIGSWIIEVRLFPSPMMIPIAIFPIFEFDWHPAQEPYDIP